MALSHLLLRADARRIPIADRSIHCCACSPPYFGLRDYQTPNQIGLEPTPGDFVDAMRAVGREIWRVLRDDGVWWLNLGDSFNSASQGNKNGAGESGLKRDGRSEASRLRTNAATAAQMQTAGHPKGLIVGLKVKDLCMIPERVALALQADGWYVRAKPPWIKPNPMPDSTDDRPNVAHESVYMLTKAPKYFFDMDAVRIPSASSTLERDTYTRVTSGKDGEYAVVHDHETPSNPNGRHLRTNDFFTASLDDAIAYHEDAAAHLRHVRDNGGMALGEHGDPLAFWMATRSFSGAHFATWPERLVRSMILSSTSGAGACPSCLAPLIRVTSREKAPYVPLETYSYLKANRQLSKGQSRQQSGGLPTDKIGTIGWRPSCSCVAGDPVPCTVMDCFGGAQTTGVVAAALGRNYVGLDLNQDYLLMGKKRIERPHASTERPPRGDEDLPLFAGL